MLFSQFNKETVITKDGVYNLNEGIDHIEALPVDEFIEAIEKLADFTVTEKIDGSNLIFGIDMDGKLFTSREAKAGGKFYSAADYDDRPASNGMKSAHVALEKALPRLKEILSNGDKVEIEILFGRQPNAIVYGSNYIAFLRMLPGDNKEEPQQDKIQKLAKAMKETVVSANTSIAYTDNGVELKMKDVRHKWKFVSTSFLDSKQFADVDVSSEIDKLKKFLAAEHPVGKLGLTNMNIMGVNLMSVPKDIRPAVKQARTDIIKQVNDNFKLPIKEKILDSILRKLKPSLQDVEIESHENVGIEGVVALDPRTLKQFKIVDKDVFTIINNFNYAVRNEIKATKAKHSKFEASVSDQDIFGDMLKGIARVIGMPDMGFYTKIKRTLRKFAGQDQKETLKNFTKSFAEKDFRVLKTKVVASIEEGLTDLSRGLDKYHNEWKDYQLELKTGSVIKYTKEIHSRTLIVFAEVRQEMNQMLANVQKAKSPSAIAVSLYGKQLKGIHG